MLPNHWLDRVAEQNEKCSDYRLSKLLGVSKQAISRIRQGKTHSLDEATAHRVEVLLGLEPGTVMLDQLQERASNPEVREVWKKLGKLVAGVAATLVLAIGMAASGPAHAYASISGGGVWGGSAPASGVENPRVGGSIPPLGTTLLQTKIPGIDPGIFVSARAISIDPSAHVTGSRDIIATTGVGTTAS